MRSSREEETKNVHDSSVSVTSIVSSSTSRLMLLHRLFSVDTAKTLCLIENKLDVLVHASSV